MWMQNNYVRTAAGIALAALLLVAVTSQPSSADNSGTQEASAPQQCDANCPNAARTFSNQRTSLANDQPATLRDVQRRQLTQAYPSPWAGPAYSQPSGFVQPASVPARSPYPQPPVTRPPFPQSGLPSGTWTNETPLGKVTMTTNGNKISIEVDGSGEFAMFSPSVRGEYSIASDGTIYGIVHSVDLGIDAAAAQEMGEEMMFLSGLSDIPFTMRAYSEPGVLAIKQVTFGIPMQAMIATDGEFSEVSVYAQSMLAGQYELVD